MDESRVLNDVWERWTSGRRPEVPGAIESEGDEMAVLKRYLGLQGDLHWEKKDLSAVLSLSHFALHYARKRSRREAENVLLYNVASFTLPWWTDSLPSTPWQRRQGLESAAALLPLRATLNKGAADFSKAHWVLGAHHLYRGAAEPAVEQFNLAVVRARECSEKNLEACALEGLGRTRVRLVPREREWGFENLGEARALYNEVGDSFNLKELEAFLGGKPS